MTRTPWSSAQIALVRELYADVSTAVIAARVDRPVSAVYQLAARFGLKKSAAYLASPAACRLRREATPASIATRFEPGHVPANKGLRRPGWAPGRMAETQFKAGCLNGRAAMLWLPIGATRWTKEGYLQLKVTDTGNTVTDFVEAHRLIWEDSNGPIPAGSVVVFRDGDRENLLIENLELVTRGELLRRNSVHRWGQEVFEVIQLRGALNRKLRRLSEKQDIGLAQPSV